MYTEVPSCRDFRGRGTAPQQERGSGSAGFGQCAAGCSRGLGKGELDKDPEESTMPCEDAEAKRVLELAEQICSERSIDGSLSELVQERLKVLRKTRYCIIS